LKLLRIILDRMDGLLIIYRILLRIGALRCSGSLMGIDWENAERLQRECREVLVERLGD
jgi:hypothetical protein